MAETQHKVTTGMQGTLGHRPLYAWNCTCGEGGVMLPWHSGAIRESQRHLRENGVAIEEVTQ